VLDISGFHAIQFRVDAVDDVIQMVHRVYVVIRIARAEVWVVDVIDGGAQLFVEEPTLLRQNSLLTHGVALTDRFIFSTCFGSG
jgi:hypothetical protein